jgi:hypothetical protein
VNIVNEIGQNVLISIHTEDPDLYPILFGSKVRMVKDSVEVW